MSDRDLAGVASAIEHLNWHLLALNHTCQIVDVLIPDDELVITGDKLIIDMSTLYLRDNKEKLVRERFRRLGLSIPWTIITSDVTYYGKNEPNIVYYPIYLIDGILKGRDTTINIKHNRQHLACFLTYHLHYHRLLMFIALHNQPWFNSCLVNLQEVSKMTSSQLQGYTNGCDSLTDDEKNQAIELLKLAPLVADTNDQQIEIVDINNKAFRDACVNIFTESDYPNGNFITEKSIKPFLSGQIPAVIAHPTVYKHLEELGFDMLNECINLNTDTLDIRYNIAHLMKEVDQLSTNIEEKWNNSYTQRLHNYNLARSPDLINNLTRDLRKWLELHGV